MKQRRNLFLTIELLFLLIQSIAHINLAYTHTDKLYFQHIQQSLFVFLNGNYILFSRKYFSIKL